MFRCKRTCLDTQRSDIATAKRPARASTRQLVEIKELEMPSHPVLQCSVVGLTWVGKLANNCNIKRDLMFAALKQATSLPCTHFHDAHICFDAREYVLTHSKASSRTAKRPAYAGTRQLVERKRTRDALTSQTTKCAQGTKFLST